MKRTLNQDFFKKWSPEMAYVLGYFAADGSMIENKRGGHYIEFTSTDLILIKNVQRAVGSHHTITKRQGSKTHKMGYRLQIGSTVWFSDLEALGFTANKSKTMCFPYVPPQDIAHFIRGYFDGDGCVYFANLKFADRVYKRWVLMTLFTSGSKSFLEALHVVLMKYGVTKGVIKNKIRGFELAFSHRDSLALYKFMYNTSRVSYLYLPRKREKLAQALKVLKLDK